MTKYVKKRIPVEAMQFVGPTPADNEKLIEFANHLIKVERSGCYVYDRLHDTWVHFKPGDWIVKGVKGEFYPVEEAVFAETYEEYRETPKIEPVQTTGGSPDPHWYTVNQA